MPKPDSPSKECLARAASLRVAVVGGGLGGLMAARMLARWGVKVTVYEARAQVGGRVLSDSTFAKGRIIEAGAELIGSIHTRWCALAKEYGISLISRMNDDLYRDQQLQQRVILDQLLIPEEIADLGKQMRERVLQPMAEFASQSIPAGTESKPWTQPGLVTLDRTSVADALEKRFGVSRTERLWRAMELFLVNNNVSRLEHMNFLALLCLVRGGQTERRAGKPVTLAEEPEMGYWDELETYRCGDGCQRLAQLIAAEVHARKGCRVIRNMGVRRIDLRPPGGGVLVTARTTKDTRFDQWLREKIPANPLMDTRRYDCVVFAVPPTVWGDIEITPVHPKDVIGLMGSGAAVKFFSVVKERFWVKDGYRRWAVRWRSGRSGKARTTRSTARAGHRVERVHRVAYTEPDDYKKGLARLYPADPRNRDSGYLRNLRKPLTPVRLVEAAVIRTGYLTSSRSGLHDRQRAKRAVSRTAVLRRRTHPNGPFRLHGRRHPVRRAGRPAAPQPGLPNRTDPSGRRQPGLRRHRPSQLNPLDRSRSLVHRI